MTKKQTNNRLVIANTEFKKLSIQVSLNGLSFCVADNLTQKILVSDEIIFDETQTPITILGALKELLEKHKITKEQFEDVLVIHKNTLFSLVPKSLFNPDKLSSYLTLNATLLATDVLAYDEVKHQDVVNVYVPYMNVNNYIYELFGAFTYVHNGTTFIESVLNKQEQDLEKTCYVYVGKNQLDIAVIQQRKLLLYNSFEFNTKEDFTYYLLFVMEQMELDTAQTTVKLFGAIEEGDPIYELCYTYIENINVYAPAAPNALNMSEPMPDTIDFTLLNTL